MARFPKVQFPCPYKANLAAHMTGDVCRMCDRQVHNLSAMSEAQRSEFLAQCGEEVCVSYQVPARAALGAALIATSLQAMPLAAAEFDPPAGLNQVLSDSAANSLLDCDTLEMIVVGGIKTMSEAQYIDTDADLELPELPVVYESESGSTTVPGE